MKRFSLFLSFGFTLAILSTSANGASIPSYLLDQAIGLIEGAVKDAATGFVTRPGTSLASASTVERDTAVSLSLSYYANALQPIQRTTQINHLRGEEHDGGGYQLRDRRFSFHDYQVWGYDPEYGIIFTSGANRVSGSGIGLPTSPNNTWIEGTTKHWDATYVAHSTYNNSGTEGLRQPGGDFPIIIKYKLADLSYQTNSSVGAGLTSNERTSYKTAVASVSRINPDKVTNIDLLETNTEITYGPYAYGTCKRIWKLKWPSVRFSELPPLGSASTLLNRLINESEWEVHELPIDYGNL
jgi:hypothetical protein